MSTPTKIGEVAVFVQPLPGSLPPGGESYANVKPVDHLCRLSDDGANWAMDDCHRSQRASPSRIHCGDSQAARSIRPTRNDHSVRRRFRLGIDNTGHCILRSANRASSGLLELLRASHAHPQHLHWRAQTTSPGPGLSSRRTSDTTRHPQSTQPQTERSEL
jgi:hypothetical protein